MSKAILKNYRQSPRKVRLVANSVRGKKVSVALVNLSFVPKKAADPLKKLIESAVANATNNTDVKMEDLVVKSIQVDQGFTMKRWMPRARGTAHPIRKKTCKVTVVLDNIDNK
jgi:large subunit ribosomal protein L22